MEALFLNAGLGAMVVGMKAAGFEPVLAIEPTKRYRATVEANTGVRCLESLPSIDQVPRHECLCAPFRLGMTVKDQASVVRILSTCRPRGALFEFGDRWDPSPFSETIDKAGYKSWSIRLNSKGWSEINRRSTFTVAFRSDIKTWFSEFPFPEETKTTHEFPGGILVDARGGIFTSHCAHASEWIGFPKGFDMSKVDSAKTSRAILAEPSVELVRSIGVEMKGWLA